MIGGKICHQAVPADQLTTDTEPRPTANEFIQSLWPLFAAIGQSWKTSSSYSSEMKSRWREFITEKVLGEPSYAAEYANALEVLAELEGMFGAQLYQKLFFENGVPDGPPVTRLAHMKRFVVDEFIRVHVASGGFRSFGAENYRGWVSGSRVSAHSPYRTYDDKSEVQ